jgi:polyisoprenoid-binding protein YceI
VDTGHGERDEHLRGADFFDVANHPEIRFQSGSVRQVDGGVYEIIGDLSLHGVTRAVTVKAEHIASGKDPWGGYRTGFLCHFVIQRSDFGIDAYPDAVGNRVELTVSIEGIREQ